MGRVNQLTGRGLAHEGRIFGRVVAAVRPVSPAATRPLAVPAAEAAANASPTDPHLAEALWAAAATQVFAGRLSAATSTLLAEPWRATGLILPT